MADRRKFKRFFLTQFYTRKNCFEKNQVPAIKSKSVMNETLKDQENLLFLNYIHDIHVEQIRRQITP